MPAPSDSAGMGITAWQGDKSALHGDLTPLLPFAGLKRSQRSQGQTLFLHRLFSLVEALGRRVFGNYLFMVPILCFRVRKAGVELMASMA